MTGIPASCPECGRELVRVSAPGTGENADLDRIERVECTGDPQHVFPVLPAEGDPSEYQLGPVEPPKDD
ncbi:MAG: hypothetical protein K0S15_1726 [Solirubrobacterales bacterium]|jgi:hypothetical protein|nr:hypothetical protein [Solirubrobacterales bacterium]